MKTEVRMKRSLDGRSAFAYGVLVLMALSMIGSSASRFARLGPFELFFELSSEEALRRVDEARA